MQPGRADQARLDQGRKGKGKRETERERAEEGWAEQGKATISPLGINFWASMNPYTMYTTAIGTIRPGTHTHRPAQHIADTYTHTYVHVYVHARM